MAEDSNKELSQNLTPNPAISITLTLVHVCVNIS